MGRERGRFSRWSRALVGVGILAVVTLVALPAGAVPPPGAGGSISGLVMDAGTGNPVAGICVNVQNGGSATTDSSGAYEVDGVPAGSYVVQYRDCNTPQQYLDQWYLGHDNSNSADQVTVTDGVNTPLQDVQLTLGVSVAGTVTDTQGTPLGGVSVNVNSTNAGPSAGTQTAPDGTYRTSPLPAGDYKVQFSDNNTPAWAHEFWNGKPSWNTSDTLTLTSANAPLYGGIDAQLSAAATISGTVTGAGGAPIGGVCVSANVPNNGGWDWTAGANTAPDGTYTITQLPPVSVAIQFHDCNGGSPYIDQWYDNQPSFQQATMISLAAGDDRQAVDAQLASGISVSGTVTDPGGNPIPGINVNVNPTSSGPNAWAQTGSNGNYTTNALPPGDYRVQFSANNPNPAWATQYWNDKPSWNSADILTLTPGDAPTRAGIDATLAAAATISGTVTGPNGAPVQGECVNAIVNGPNGYDGIGNTNTAADGTYSIQGLPADSYLVYFQDCNNVGPFQDQWWNDQPDPSSANAVTVGAGTTTAGIDAHLDAAAQIEGHVTDGGGHPIEGICAQATSASAVGGMARTNSSGDYAINIAQPGAYKVQFIDCNQTPTYAGQWWDNQPTAATATVVNVAAAQVVDHVDASLAPGAAATVSGRIVNIHGTPMTDACVVVYAANQLALFGQVQPDGSYSIPNVPSGTYALAALGCGTGGGGPSPVVPDPDSPTTNFAALWWKNVPLSLDQNSQGGPDPIAQGADLVAIAPGQNATGYDWCFGCAAIVISDIVPGTSSVSLTYDTPGLVPADGGAQSSATGASGSASASASGGGSGGVTAQARAGLIYTASCASTSGGTPGSATGTSSSLTVTGLTSGATYTCQISASDGTTTVAASDVSAAVTLPGSAQPAAASEPAATKPAGALAFTGAALVTKLGWYAVLLLTLGLACLIVARRRSRTVS